MDYKRGSQTGLLCHYHTIEREMVLESNPEGPHRQFGSEVALPMTIVLSALSVRFELTQWTCHSGFRTQDDLL